MSTPTKPKSALINRFGLLTVLAAAGAALAVGFLASVVFALILVGPVLVLGTVVIFRFRRSRRQATP